ncbi:uncharacterized protein LOC144457780 [Phascolarctos cinereus]
MKLQSQLGTNQPLPQPTHHHLPPLHLKVRGPAPERRGSRLDWAGAEAWGRRTWRSRPGGGAPKWKKSEEKTFAIPGCCRLPRPPLTGPFWIFSLPATGAQPLRQRQSELGSNSGGSPEQLSFKPFHHSKMSPTSGAEADVLEAD